METTQAILDAFAAVRRAALDERKPIHYQRPLTADERAHYAWLQGNYAPQELLDEVYISVDPELLPELANHGIESPKDFQDLLRQHETTQGERDDLESERDGLLSALEAVRDYLEVEDTAGANTVTSFLEDLAPDRFGYKALEKLRRALL